MPASHASSLTVSASPSPSSVGLKALLTRMSSLPQRSMAFCTIAAISSCLPTLVEMVSAVPPAARMASALASASAMLMSAMSTLAPCSASRRDVAPPMPAAPPVTIATLPANFVMFDLRLDSCFRRNDGQGMDWFGMGMIVMVWGRDWKATEHKRSADPASKWQSRRRNGLLALLSLACYRSLALSRQYLELAARAC